ncbi:hypothetical protein QQF64_018174 [Cirrhinus molitorella]|uniref:Uncharacterized protein n=1 Tax=Cirrhinus molitorella TaxID=172907 RepID=A0ABR3LN91_9TELE
MISLDFCRLTDVHVGILSDDIWRFITCEEDQSGQIRSDIQRRWPSRVAESMLTAATEELHIKTAAKGHINPSKHHFTRFTLKLRFMLAMSFF